MDKVIATDFIAANKGQMIEVRLMDETTATGVALSINSKGVNIKNSGATRSFSLSKVADLVLPGTDDTDTDTDTTDLDIEAGLADGMTTRELADVFGIAPKELRVHLRALGLGVGKGRTYSLAVADYRAVKALVAANA